MENENKFWYENNVTWSLQNKYQKPRLYSIGKGGRCSKNKTKMK